jgi:hypothetical protein
MMKIFSHLDVNKVKPKDVEKFLPMGVTINVTGEFKFKKGKIKLPKHLKVDLSSSIVLPELPDLNVSFSLGGAVAKKTALDELTETMSNIGFPGFVFSQEETGILKVKGHGSEFAFIIPPDGVEQLDESVKPELVVNEAGSYEIIVDSGRKFTLAPALADVEGLVEAIPDIKVEVNEHGETQIEMPDKNQTIMVKFNAEVQSVSDSTKVGIEIEGTPGIDEVAKYYNKGKMQILHPVVYNRNYLRLATPPLIGYGLDFKFRVDGKIGYNYKGFEWIATPELTLTTIAKRQKSVLNVIKPSELVELFSSDGKRQVYHIKKVGKIGGESDIDGNARSY